MDIDKFDCDLTDFPVCPFCGNEETDVYAIDDHGDNLSCGVCSKDYHVEVNVSVTYTTSII